MSGDFISRDAALIVLDWDCASQDALDAIKAIPAADVVEVRHAYKIDITATKDFFLGTSVLCVVIADCFLKMNIVVVVGQGWMEDKENENVSRYG